VSIHVGLSHITHYRYDRAVTLSPQLVRLRPAPHCRAPILSYSQRVDPKKHFLNWQQDPYSNYVARLTFPDKVRELRIEIDLVTELAVYNPFDFFLEPDAEHFPFTYETRLLQELQPFLRTDAATPRFDGYLSSLARGRRRTIDMLVDLNGRLSRDIGYVIRLDPGVQSADDTLRLGTGSCRDSTWLLVQLFRHLGIAARFVSGYLIQLAPDTASLAGPSGPVRDFADLHAWCEVYLPGAGWVGLDPTSGLLAGEGHLPLACTPEPGGAAPVTGGVEKSEVEFTHTMAVSRIYESPRVTKPYSDEAWTAIQAAARAVDADLIRHDVRLTMGGEPTFVAIDDRDEPEWNTEALGPTKRLRAADLLWRMKALLTTDALVHFGQGKWYPGEQLPRWALGCYWRADGLAVWRNAALFADEDHPDGSSPADAERFLRALAERLGLTDEHVLAGYEDVWYYLWRERRLPVNVDPFDARLDDELERVRLRRVFDRGLDTPVGYILPLRSISAAVPPRPNAEAAPRWRTGPWFLRDERLYLVPGDSPMGYRLPLDSLPWMSEHDLPQIYERDPSAPRQPLPPYPSSPEQTGGPGAPPQVQIDRPPARGESASWTFRTAICAEARQGVLYIFMPPAAALEQYLDLVAAVEDTAAVLGIRIIVEGYRPPDDVRLKHFLVTPDPGVIEVNVQPASDWRELDEQTTMLYAEARKAGLTTEKFMLDGRHTGTGGGNHFVLGGATPLDSPFLRRPDLLRSLASYWHNHPSLSYLFSGMFLGPTSQAPRVDEARHDSVYELELAFGRLAVPGDAAPPWQVDRALRHLLVDVTGNTHRAEFCIDKMFPPESASGRRGLLELRAFEMPPHERMSLAQQLLLRALVARFWRQPYEARLTRWGTALHDRFMLPYFIWQDFEDVIEEAVRAGYRLEADWFRPHFEFRFPLAGEMALRGAQFTLRQALEPWPVLGEEGSVGTTVRYVDSSLERLQVQVTGLVEDRFVVTCNGVPIPLQPTGRNGESVAGVRYRAWQPSSALHPTIPVHAPLTFDLVDTWMRRSLGGCQYHVSHPGGLSYDRLPINSYEAESRRLGRFFRLGHTPGPMTAERAVPSREFPHTLDLRVWPDPR
jgi:uncharacterized protein (DUF2126 family)/transglutaminase-like putative cysteine protease